MADSGYTLIEGNLSPNCPDCGEQMMAPAPAGEPGDDSYYCENCGQAWALDMKHRAL